MGTPPALNQEPHLAQARVIPGSFYLLLRALLLKMRKEMGEGSADEEPLQVSGLLALSNIGFQGQDPVPPQLEHLFQGSSKPSISTYTNEYRQYCFTSSMFYKYTSIVYVYTAISSLTTMLGERLASLSDILVVHYWFSEAILY